MDYKEKYEKALATARKLYNKAKANEYTSDMEDYEAIFPELAESEDKRIRKALISFLKSPFVNENIIDEKVAPWIAWLEKQGEQKSYASETMNEKGDFDSGFTRMMEKEQKLDAKIEPKFHEGEWITIK